MVISQTKVEQMRDDLIHPELSKSIIGAAMNVLKLPQAGSRLEALRESIDHRFIMLGNG
jgi:hypothetical protein